MEVAQTLHRGIYYFAGSCTNLPVSNACHVFLGDENSSFLGLIAVDTTTSKVYSNSKRAGSDNWLGWVELATKGDLPKIIYVSQHETADRITINSGENISIDIPFTAQPGYKFVAIIDAWTDNDNVTTSNRYRKVENNNNFIHVNARNFSTQNNISVRIYTSILFIANI